MAEGPETTLSDQIIQRLKNNRPGGALVIDPESGNVGLVWQVLLLDEQGPARLEPYVPRNDLVLLHGVDRLIH